ncbi:MAG: hypothetical protein ABIR37_03355 [Candidatus Saccharimonadales bacterium]
MSESFRFTPPPKPASNPAPEPPDEDVEPEYNPRARLDYLHTVNPPKKKRLWLRILIAVLVLALLAGAGVFAYPRFIKKQAATPATKQSTTGAKQSTQPQTDKITTKHFDSTNFNLGFEYPDTWTVNDNAETARLTVTSPASSRKTLAGEAALVRTVVTIAAKGQNLAAFDKGSGLAVLASEKIKYVSPTSAQRAETYLTFVQNSSTPSGDGMDGIYITGDHGYQKDQYIPKTDMTGLDPVITVTFEKCTDSKCTTTPVVVSLRSTDWDDTALKNPLLTLLKSIAVN